ncbi:UNVERIFIED_CONTAM: hypothetical protein Sradi_0813600 [Sesamum radiatum]|uniref:Retroviral polymerase SH3-like domain-containing protein n=1 Tax=Sesamum radiatum TaxID=300843 RepID=A0AAW2VVI4_SESRA
MFESHLPNTFWAESILAATHIINRLPSVTLQWKTPYELLYNKPPSYTNLKTFGCLCFASNNTPHKSKFDPRAFKCIFIGYVQGQKGYKLFDLDNHVIIISRDVTFHEHIFPYINHSELSPSPMLFPTSILDHPTDLIQPGLPPAPIFDPNPPTPTLPVTQIPDSDPPLRRSQRHIVHNHGS